MICDLRTWFVIWFVIWDIDLNHFWKWFVIWTCDLLCDLQITAAVGTERGSTARHWSLSVWPLTTLLQYWDSIHWLPGKQRIDFKLAMLVYKSLHDIAPPYLSDDCQLVTEVGRRHLRSSNVQTCTLPRIQSQIGDRSFTAAGPRLRNSLPIENRRKDITFEHYRRLLKAFLFV